MLWKLRGIYLLAILLAGLVLAGCEGESPAPATSTIEPATAVPPSSTVPAPTPTPRDPAQDCVEAPAELGNPGPLRREEADGAVVFVAEQVSDEDRDRVLQGLAAAREFIQREFGPVERQVCLEIRTDEQRAGAALTIQDRVVIYTEPGGWSRPYPWLLSRATAHEYVHVWSAVVANDFAPSNSIAYGPGWLVEGIAEYLSMRMILEAGLAPQDEAEAFTNTLLRLSMAGLEDLTNLPLPNAEDYATAELGVRRLMESRPLAAIERYYRALGDRTLWPTAFSQAFSISPTHFYAEFAATPTP